MSTLHSCAVAIVLRSTNLVHFRLMLASLRVQTMLPTEVLYVGLPISGSAIVQSVLKHPLGNNVEQRLVWCADAMTDERAVNWCILESVAGATTAEYIVFVGSDVVLHPAFVETLVRRAAENAIATSFPMILSPELSNQLSEVAVAKGEPFSSLGMLAVQRLLGKASAMHRILPLGPLGKVLDRLALRQHLSTSAIGISCHALERLLSARQWCDGASVRRLLSCAEIAYRRVTHQARHVLLTESRPQIFALAPVMAPEWKPSSLGLFEVRPVLRRHQLN